MNNSTAVAARSKTVSAGTLLLVSCGLALYQMTSLVLAPPAIRQINLSMSVPAVNADEQGAPLGGDITVVLGEVAAIVQPRPPVPAARYVQVARRAPVGSTIPVRSGSVPAAIAPVGTPQIGAPVPLPVAIPLSAEHGNGDRGHGRHLRRTPSQD